MSDVPPPEPGRHRADPVEEGLSRENVSRDNLGRHDESRLMSNTAVMAAGTIVSRFSGYLRSILLAAAIGNLLAADVFNIANTIPNMLYILLAGGAINAVLVPQLIRAMRNDPDGGDAYTNRIITLAALFLGGVTLLLIVIAPWIMSIYVNPSWSEEARQSTVAFARYCLPQVFFYGMFVLVGQILNARGRFGPMMWAPIANNVISVLVLIIYLVVFGSADRSLQGSGDFSTAQELLLGLGSTLGIVAQLVILVPFLRSAGFRYVPRFDLRGSGLGHTLRLGVWTVGFVVLNQIAYAVVVRLASAGTGLAAGTSEADTGTGYTVYSSTYLIAMVPHSIITVSLATALLPLLSTRAAAGDLAGLGRSLSNTLRTALVLVVSFAFLLPLIAPDLARIVWGWGAAADTVSNYNLTLSLFGPALVFFTIHYLMLRGFYALERNSTVFWIQCVVAVVNVGAAVLLVGLLTDGDGNLRLMAPALVIAYALAYVAGALTSYLTLRRRVGACRPPC